MPTTPPDRGVIVAGLARDDRDGASSALAELLAAAFDARVAEVHADDRAAAPRVLHEAARDLGALVLVVGATHQGATGRMLPGAVSERLLHGAPCPVAIAPAGYAQRELDRPRVGVAFDGRAEARAALELAIDLAGRLDGSVDVYTACPPYDAEPDAVAPGWTAVSTAAVARHRHAHETLALARGLVPPAVRGDVELLPGRPEDALAEASNDVDLLVCGSRGHGPFRTVLLGGVSTALAHRSVAPLIVVPRGAEGGAGIHAAAASRLLTNRSSE